MVDFRALAEPAHAHGVPFIVETAYPYLAALLEHGADVAVSATLHRHRAHIDDIVTCIGQALAAAAD